MAIAITNAEQEWYGGVAYLRAACNSRGNLVYSDSGSWRSVFVGAHEIGHALGAPHDEDANYPGGCDARGYIMSGGSDEFKWFFSTCSDRTIGDFVSSDQASCLRRIDESGPPVVSPDFSSNFAPSMEEQCQRMLNNSNAFVPDDGKSNCISARCWLLWDDGGGWWIWGLSPVDNTPCEDGGRCFRGRCRKPGSLIMNVGTGQCMRATNPFTPDYSYIEMVDCVRPGTGTPLDLFTITDESNGKLLATPYSSPDAKENGDKCVVYGNGAPLWTDRCNSGIRSHGWDFLDVGDGEFLMRNRGITRCAKAEGGRANTDVCDESNRAMRWKLL